MAPRRDIHARIPLIVALLGLTLTACAARGPAEADLRPGWSQTGIASWYGHPFHGRQTASGEVYDMERMTAAHRWLPFGTRLRVENRDNGRVTEVRVNDRGPFVRGRIVDLSRAAAETLGMVGPGTARVRLVVLALPEPPSCLELQVGAYRESRNVESVRAGLRHQGLGTRTEAGPGGTIRVIAGPFPDLESARRARDRHGGIVRACPAD